jgi:hypothetical protein
VEVPTNLTDADARWHPYAACADTGPDGSYERPAAARRLCLSCPAAEPCLWAALALEQVLGYRYGVWGGTSAARRDRIAAGLPTSTSPAAIWRWLTPGRCRGPTDRRGIGERRDGPVIAAYRSGRETETGGEPSRPGSLPGQGAGL